ncbi:hypothetical protein [Actinosynnema pretiosum]|uniref:hypothetical protein n=1 Tax=Actinosynnema pretiosum TaxID=42197 RepID=UPI001E4FAC79|nr:hypothetical protein [Actinosynnema pretiosum]
MTTRVHRERSRQSPHRHGVSFQRTRTWKTSTDPAFDAELDRVDEVRTRSPKRCFALGQFGPLAIRPHHGSGSAPRRRPDRRPATYRRTRGIRCFHGCCSVGDDRLRGVTPTSSTPNAANGHASAANATNAGTDHGQPDQPGERSRPPP